MPDIAVTEQNADSVAVLLGRGDGTFDAPLEIPTGPFPAAVAVADLDGNGTADLVTADSLADTVLGPARPR